MHRRETTVCELCGSSRSQTLFVGEDIVFRSDGAEFPVVQCTECGLRYVNPRPAASEVQVFYPPAYYVGDPPKQRRGVEWFAKWLSRGIKRVIMQEYYGYPTTCQSWLWRTCRKWLLFPDWLLRVVRGRELLPYIGQGKLLDVGCGVGVNLKVFQEQGWEVSGVEMSESAVIRARELVGDCVHLGTLDTAPFPRESFDAIVFSHSLEHMYKPGKALLQAARLLKPQGRLVVTVPNAAGLEARLFGEHWIGWDLPRHLFHFDRNTLLAMLEKTGFRVVRIRTGKGSAFFMPSLMRYVAARYKRSFPAAKMIDRMLVRPLTLITGHLGYGTEITVYAEKAQPAAGRGA